MRYFIWGATGQARVVRPILDAEGHTLGGIVDRDDAIPAPFADISGVHTPAVFLASSFDEPTGFVVAIGGSHGRDRLTIATKLVGMKLIPLNAIHSRAFVADSATIGIGVQVMAMAAIGEGASVGDQVIINTSASVDHDCRIAEGVHIMPGATLAGEVIVKRNVTVGSNATILPRLTLSEGCFVGAGAVVTRDVPAFKTVVGNPARVIVQGDG